MSRRRIFLKDIRAHDLAHDTSLVRELEMDVDHLLTVGDYSQQFWRDMQVYGLREALLYLLRQTEVYRASDLEAVEALKKTAVKIAKVFGQELGALT